MRAFGDFINGSINYKFIEITHFLINIWIYILVHIFMVDKLTKFIMHYKCYKMYRRCSMFVMWISSFQQSWTCLFSGWLVVDRFVLVRLLVAGLWYGSRSPVAYRGRDCRPLLFAFEISLPFFSERTATNQTLCVWLCWLCVRTYVCCMFVLYHFQQLSLISFYVTRAHTLTPQTVDANVQLCPTTITKRNWWNYTRPFVI